MKRADASLIEDDSAGASLANPEEGAAVSTGLFMAPQVRGHFRVHPALDACPRPLPSC